MEDKQVGHQNSHISALIRLVETLRGKNGCPWDKKQTPRSISVYLVEEMYELIAAIESKNPDDVCEELGDVLFHILFIARTFQEMGQFDITEVSRRTTEKMIRRHPHVFGDETVDDAEEVKARWHQIKMEEKNQAQTSSILDSVPKKLPALMRAYRISSRAAKVGFDWNDALEVMIKVEEEFSELKSALAEKNRANVILEFGDVLFTLVNVARFAQIHPEPALVSAIKKFEKRFKHMEQAILENGKNLESLPQSEMEVFWEDAKRKIPDFERD